MARRVYLHIGTMKSATTYLQGVYDHNRRVLADAGLLWSGSGDNFRATDDLLGTQRTRPGLDGAWKAMDSRLLAHDGDALISNELLAPISPQKAGRLVEALAPAEIHVIITARDLGRVIPSQWQESTRNRHAVTWSDFFASLRGDEGADPKIGAAFWRKQDVAGLVTRWSKFVPLDRITVVTVPASGSPVTLLGERFSSVISVDPAEFEQPAYSNASLGGHSAELLRRINARTEDVDWLHYKWAYKNALARFVLTDRSGAEPQITLSQEQLDWACGRARTMVDAIVATGVRVVGDLDDLVPVPSAEEGPLDPTDATDSEMLEVAMDGLVGMGRMLANLRIEYDAMVREIEAHLPSERPKERQEFASDEESLDEASRSVLRKGRFARWRLARQNGLPRTS